MVSWWRPGIGWMVLFFAGTSDNPRQVVSQPSQPKLSSTTICPRCNLWKLLTQLLEREIVIKIELLMLYLIMYDLFNDPFFLRKITWHKSYLKSWKNPNRLLGWANSNARLGQGGCNWPIIFAFHIWNCLSWISNILGTLCGNQWSPLTACVRVFWIISGLSSPHMASSFREIDQWESSMRRWATNERAVCWLQVGRCM